MDKIKEFNPDYIFFPHWSDIIPPEIYNNYNCVVFHIGDLPFGRGGSPVQNLIVRKIYETKITALKVNDLLDGGDIYYQVKFDLKDGTAEQLLQRASEIVFNEMISYIIRNNPVPSKQNGEAVIFKRRTPLQSDMRDIGFDDIYDHIRMLDGEGYPLAFLDTENLHITFKKVRKENDRLTGVFEIYGK